MGSFLCGERSASAFERQWHVGGDLGYSLYAPAYAGAQNGLRAGGHLAYGANDMFNIIADVNAAWFPDGNGFVFGGGAGAAYVFDVLSWVPWLGLEVSAFDVVWLDAARLCPPEAKCPFTGSGDHHFRLGPTAILGVDYQASRKVAVSLEGRYTPLFFGAEVEHLVGVSLRVEHMWGY
jgi:hypothetical protein